MAVGANRAAVGANFAAVGGNNYVGHVRVYDVSA